MSEYEEPLKEGERTGDRMEDRLGELDDQIGEAKTKAREHEEHAYAGGPDVAGDWQDESEGAQQGQDATEADEPDRNAEAGTRTTAKAEEEEREGAASDREG